MKRSSSRLGIMFWLLMIIVAGGTRRSLHAAEQPNIVLIVSDDQRPDTVAALGNPEIRTPTFDRLSREGLAFTRAFCGNPICTPSRAEILTGANSFRNGVHDFGRQIHPDFTLIPQALSSNGYHNCYVGKWHNDGRPIQRGYAETVGLFAGGGGKFAKDRVDFKGFPITGYRGWVFQDDQGNKFPEKGVGVTARTSQQIADAAIEFLKKHDNDPFFLHVNFAAPHDPLVPTDDPRWKYNPESLAVPQPFYTRHPFEHGNGNGRDERLLPWPRNEQIVRETKAAYYSVISDMDDQIGRILKQLDNRKLADNTIVIFTSDHGVGLGSHGLRGKQSMYEHTQRVPMLIRGPGIPAGERRDTLVYLRDLFPTICTWTGIDIPQSVDGLSLAPAIRDSQHRVRSEVYGYFRDRQRMIRDERWKYIEYPKIQRTQLFDLKTDPLETNDLSRNITHFDTMTKLRVKLHKWLAEQSTPPKSADVLVSFSVMGDAPYIPFEDDIIATYIRRLPKAAQFLIHVGDIKRGLAPCDEEVYRNVAAIMKKAKVPVFMLPGDNEWNDCPDPDAAWKLWVKYWMRFHENWDHKIKVEHQKVREENVSFVHEGVLFLGLNVVGGRKHNAAEWQLRHAQSLDWVRKNFYREDIKSAVVFLHAAPAPNHEDFFTPFVLEALQFKRPILLIHGDGHVWKHDQPWPAKNIQRVQVDRGGIAPPVFVQVTKDPVNPFYLDRRLAEAIPLPETPVDP
jgi:arylsulfatase A-like enzyme